MRLNALRDMAIFFENRNISKVQNTVPVCLVISVSGYPLTSCGDKQWKTSATAILNRFVISPR